MNTIKLNHWYVTDNVMSISLMRFYVEIGIVIIDDTLRYNVRVVNSDTEIKEIFFEFSSLENAITFTERIVAYCKSFDEMMEKYKVFYENREKTYKKVL